MGRKNFLFHNTANGAEASAIVYSLVESAKVGLIATLSGNFLSRKLLTLSGVEATTLMRKLKMTQGRSHIGSAIRLLGLGI